jgi:hypothetical protein
MKNILLALLILLIGSQLMAKEWVGINSDNPVAATVQLVSSNVDSSVVNFKVDGFYKSEVNTPNGTANIISVDNSTTMLLQGRPDVPKLAASLIIPDKAMMGIRITYSHYVDFLNYNIAPSKGNFTRDIDPETVPYTYDRTYEDDNFFPGNLTDVRDPYILRDFRGQTILLYPFQYNPVTKVLRVYDNVTVELYSINQNGYNPKLTSRNGDKYVAAFHDMYKSHFLNFETGLGPRYIPVEESGRMIIITYDSFAGDMTPFVHWKNQKGIKTDIYNVSTIGNNATSIKSFIQSQYNLNNGLAFVLLVGDATQIATPTASGGSSDPSYSLLEGADNYPDIFVGRFSAENSTQTQTQVNKVIYYERDLNTGDWLNKGIGVASALGAGQGDNGEADYQHMDSIRIKLTGYDYTSVDQIYDTNGGNSTMITNGVNTGRSEICYCGHGDVTYWVTTGFSVTNVNALTNDYKLPFIHSVACVNGQFAGGTCFAEAWLRAKNAATGNPTGAIAFYGSSVNQSWAPPMRAQDAAIDLLIGNQMNTIGGLWYNGSCSMMDVYGADGADMFKTWHIFGDPSTQVRTNTPTALTIVSDPTIFIGQSTYNVSTGVPNALVSLSLNYQLIASAYTDATGNAVLDLTNLPQLPDTTILTVTGYNKITYIDTIPVIVMNGPYLVCQSYMITDQNGNNQMDYGENIQLGLALKNIGNDTARNAIVTLTTLDPYITFTNNSALYTEIPPDSTLIIPNAYTFTVANGIPDNHVVTFTETTVIDSTHTWTHSFDITGHAAILQYLNSSISDPLGNNNGKLDPGETAEINVTINNTGSAPAYNISGTLTTIDSFLIVNDASQLYGQLDPGAEAQQSFSVSANANSPLGHFAPMDISMTGDYDVAGSGSFNVIIGQIPALVLDLDGNQSSGPVISGTIQSLGINVQYSTTFPANLDIYSSIFVCLGVYNVGHHLNATEGQILANYLLAGGKLYMEGGDTWYYDAPTAVHPMFHIQGIADGGNDLSSIVGQTGTLAQSMVFPYGGDNHYIDRINAIAPALLIFKNNSPLYGCGVVYDAGTYKTIGTSFEFGGLVNVSLPSTKSSLMRKYLQFFGLINSQTQQLTLDQGWNMISTNIIPDSLSISKVFSPIAGKIVILKNGQGQVYIPQYNINTIGNISPLQGYQVYLNQAATLDIPGLPVIPSLTPIPLTSGWNLISYERSSEMSVVTALGSISNILVIAKNPLGQVYVPAYNINTLVNMVPGQGYYIYVNINGTLTYPDN